MARHDAPGAVQIPRSPVPGKGSSHMASRKRASARERWTNEAWKLPDDKLRLPVPVHVVFDEAADVARFYKTYFASVKAEKGTPARPGLDTVVDPARGLGPDTAADLLSLRDVAQRAHTNHVLATTRTGTAPMARGRFLVSEIAATLKWCFAGKNGKGAAQLARLTAAHANHPASSDALAAELDGHAALASAHRKAIDGLGGFDATFIEEAFAVARELRARPPTPMLLDEKAREARNLRNRLVVLLWSRIGAIRSAARFVFRRHPEILREATSVYERRRRASTRLEKARKGKVNEAGPEKP